MKQNKQSGYKWAVVFFNMAAFSMFSMSLSGCSAQIAKSENTAKASDYNAELGIEYLQKGRLQLANQKLLKALDQNPDSAKTHHYFAILQQRLGENDKASLHFKKAISIDPKNPEIRNNYGSFLCSTNHPKEAIQEFLISVKDPLYSTPEYAYTNAGICAYKMKQVDKAENYYRLALKKNASFSSALLQMSKVYYDKRDYSRAQAFLLRYEQVGKSTPEALELCININQKMGNPGKASACTAALLRLFPGSDESNRISGTN